MPRANFCNDFSQGFSAPQFKLRGKNYVTDPEYCKVCLSVLGIICSYSEGRGERMVSLKFNQLFLWTFLGSKPLPLYTPRLYFVWCGECVRWFIEKSFYSIRPKLFKYFKIDNGNLILRKRMASLYINDNRYELRWWFKTLLDWIFSIFVDISPPSAQSD